MGSLSYPGFVSMCGTGRPASSMLVSEKEKGPRAVRLTLVSLGERERDHKRRNDVLISAPCNSVDRARKDKKLPNVLLLLLSAGSSGAPVALPHIELPPCSDQQEYHKTRGFANQMEDGKRTFGQRLADPAHPRNKDALSFREKNFSNTCGYITSHQAAGFMCTVEWMGSVPYAPAGFISTVSFISPERKAVTDLAYEGSQTISRR